MRKDRIKSRKDLEWLLIILISRVTLKLQNTNTRSLILCLKKFHPCCSRAVKWYRLQFIQQFRQSSLTDNQQELFSAGRSFISGTAQDRSTVAGRSGTASAHSAPGWLGGCFSLLLPALQLSQPEPPSFSRLPSRWCWFQPLCSTDSLALLLDTHADTWALPAWGKPGNCV